MRKVQIVLVVVLMIVGIAGVSFAGGLYIRLGGGYGLGLGGMNTGRQQTAQETWTKDVPVNVGQGFPIAVDVGCKINENLAIEVGAGYTIGIESEKINELYNVFGTGDTTAFTFKGSWIPITAGVKHIFTLGPLKPYFSVGAGAYFGTVIQKYTNGGTKEEWEITLSGINVGSYASGGVEFFISEMISIFGEARLDKVLFGASQQEVTKYTVDGVDKLPTLTINQRHGSGLPIPVATIVSADCLSIRSGVGINF
ncbi:hypothetical protein AUJ66_05515 [Candidatus Desantisbacteria bacterium CG1_02_38_46]|uniref:Outer membrane protein beta-barrel domain-containing protein n=3 Tax=unclassified Candidatus Desantisiibacteriota TaxID=3106372 RepID=A0A2H9PAQ4_9BACT|nr:MAG: hypothetical protein AUJ66_05515 [Candidatus Desantisbacteria bacterium CG1_02_38_46]PIU51987.1 MAG: hypothetical protein COS91_01610 [Candidatus Desantisbacteria bacterium CG07_land_8_20_14_0_80_39_15]PIZ15618.1 MAG: hypothetical protein COY51_04820 [Candidatus Desantisbacteria bacterium CG_4_10_14_0_8_um_filter_39_17]